MKAKEIMTGAPLTCSPGTNLAAAAALMLDGDCGILPVVDHDKLVGVVTDRDLFIALGTRDRRASDVTVGEVTAAPVVSCGPDEEVGAVLDRMREHRVRRVPVVGFGETVLGIVSMSDIVLAGKSGRPVANSALLEALQTISAHHHPVARVAAA